MAYHLFERFGLELEHMIVDDATLDVRPCADRLLKAAAALPGAQAHVDEDGDAAWPGSVELGSVTWSNELTLHVLEFKTTEPARSMAGLDDDFARAVAQANAVARGLGCRLLATGAHPWMDPSREMKLWPHDYGEVYAAFNRIFDCRGHGWANLQALHLNLPFATSDTPADEFARLHAAIRVLLPIMPAIAASTPILDGRVTGLLDSRLDVYRTNSSKIPEATGRVIPEPVYTRGDYQREILERIYKAYEPHDPAGIMRDEWTNSRGAIARFSRGTIEVRVLDVQECPASDVAVASAVAGAIRLLIDEDRVARPEFRSAGVEPLHSILLRCIREADQARIDEPWYLELLGLTPVPRSALQVWTELLARAADHDPALHACRSALGVILSRGSLSRRILSALKGDTSRAQLHAVYRALSASLASNHPFEG